MHTLARVILAVVTVFVIVVTATLVFKTRSATVEPLAGPPPSLADLDTEQVDLEEVARGVRRRANADPGRLVDHARRTKALNVNAHHLQPQGARATVGDDW